MAILELHIPLYNQSSFIKFRKCTSGTILSNIQAILESHQLSLNVLYRKFPLIRIQSRTRYRTQMASLSALLSSKTVPQLFFVFYNTDIFEKLKTNFLQTVPQFGFICFLIIRFKLTLWGKNATYVTLYRPCAMSGGRACQFISTSLM